MNRTFKIDHRDNPGLHRLYVRYALEELEIINLFLKEMFKLSRVTASIIAGDVMRAKRELIMEEAAWFEAAALVEAGADTSEYFEDETIH
jgi:hypothetical protein